MRILWLKTELLHPVDKGGKIRTYQMLKVLKQRHHVTYLTLDDGRAAPDAAERAAEYCHDLVRVPLRPATKPSLRFYLDVVGSLFTRHAYAIGRYASRAFAERLAAMAVPGATDLVVSDFLAPAVNLPGRLPVPVVLFQHNVEAVLWKRHCEVAGNLASRALFRLQYARVRRFEGDVCRAVDGVITVSEDDSRTIVRDYGDVRVLDVPTGIDTEFFRPSGAVPRKPNELVFTGSMDWMPNDDAARWFLDDILPRIHRENPAVTVTFVGRDPYRWLTERARIDSRIVVTGRVPDIRPFIERAALYIVPLRVGGGTRLKIYEGMAMECPMVSTTVGAEGLRLTHGEDLLLADTAAGFAETTLRLLRDPAAARTLAEHAAGRMRREFSWQFVGERFAAICERVAADWRATNPTRNPLELRGFRT